MKTKLEFSSGGIVINNNQVLVIKTKNLKNEVVYTFPKGHIEPKESSQDAALREVEEETGVKCKIIKKIKNIKYWFVYKGEKILKQVTWYLMQPIEIPRGIHLSDSSCGIKEVDEVLWIDLDKVTEILSYKSDKEIISLVKQQLNKG